MNNDLISRSALIKSYFNHCRTDFENENCCMANENVFNIIYNAPTVDERPHGKWIIDGHHIRCDRCNEYICNTDREGNKIPDNFCPNCGAEMRGDEE